MMQTEMSRATREDKKYLEEQIKELEMEIAGSLSVARTKKINLLVEEQNKELRRLRRMR